MLPYRFFVLAFFIGRQSIIVAAQSGTSMPVVKISGEVTMPLNLSATDLATMKHTTVTLQDRGGKTSSYTGVAVQEILTRAGVTMGKQLRGENLTKYLMVKCADGYEVLFSLAELDSGFTNRTVILANVVEGKPLPANQGPFRLIVPDEKRPARSGFQVTEFVVRFAKE